MTQPFAPAFTKELHVVEVIIGPVILVAQEELPLATGGDLEEKPESQQDLAAILITAEDELKIFEARDEADLVWVGFRSLPAALEVAGIIRVGRATDRISDQHRAIEFPVEDLSGIGAGYVEIDNVLGREMLADLNSKFEVATESCDDVKACVLETENKLIHLVLGFVRIFTPELGTGIGWAELDSLLSARAIFNLIESGFWT
ncbi:hypothetical protein HG530_003430 [Fusarium avenaceum]|nr:hypothetical protein HG530_003430 [Fusarium avenaceum]